MKNSIQEEFDSLFVFDNKEEEIDFKASNLAMQFLGIVDQKMATMDINKKELAKEIGTSASFITQLFRGDRKPNWNVLAKMADVLKLEFKILTEEMHQENMNEAVSEYHKKWVRARQYEQLKGFSPKPDQILIVESQDEDYAMAS